MIPSLRLLSALPCRWQPTTSLIGLLLSLASCSMALVISSTDQTGRHLAEVSRAFQNSLSTHGMNGTYSRENSARLLSFRDSAPDPRRTLHGASKRLSLETAYPLLSDDNLSTLQDANEPAYLHLLSELQRFCQVSTVDVFDGELAIDLLWPSQKSDGEIADGICDMIQSLETHSNGFELEYQLTVWAASPVRSAFLDAALQSAKLQSLVENQQASHRLAPLRLSSSGQVWNSGKAIRPAVTLVIRRIGRTKS